MSATSGRTRFVTFRLTPSEHECVREAAEDAHLNMSEYSRLMILAAAGMGGAIEHLQRVVQASIVAEDAATPKKRRRS